jgi:hypothetical protein
MGTKRKLSEPRSGTKRQRPNCVYVCIARFDKGAVSRAFDATQKAAGVASRNVQKAKNELHVTLWHRNSSSMERGHACVAAEGETIKFAVTGFDLSGRISAARVRRLDAQQQAPHKVSLHDLKKALDVQAPHITLWFAKGTHWRPVPCITCSTALTLHPKPFILVLVTAVVGVWVCSADPHPGPMLHRHGHDRGALQEWHRRRRASCRAWHAPETTA